MRIEFKADEARNTARIRDDGAIRRDGDGTTADRRFVHGGSATKDRAACVKSTSPRQEAEIFRRLLPLMADDDDDIRPKLRVMAEDFWKIEVVAYGATVFYAVDFEQVCFIARLDAFL